MRSARRRRLGGSAATMRSTAAARGDESAASALAEENSRIARSRRAPGPNSLPSFEDRRDPTAVAGVLARPGAEVSFGLDAARGQPLA